MKLLEYEAKELLAEVGVPVPRGQLAIEAANSSLPLPCVLKSQVPTGGRGKAGGVVVVKTPAEYDNIYKKLLQLDIKGSRPQTILAEELLYIERELYLSLVINKIQAGVILMAHRKGGVEVEENAGEEFLQLPLDGANSITAGQQLADYYDLPEQTFALQDLVKNLYSLFYKQDMTLCEINPLIVTTEGKLVAGDAKVTLDDAAAFRHPEWHFEDEKRETNFVTLDPRGTVATIANGAGLAMATVDAVSDAGMIPANFLDIGGGASEASVLTAFRRIMEYPDVKVIVINIFAGITRCDEVAKAIIAARAQINGLPPVAIRLAGTNYEEAEKLLTEERILIHSSLRDALVTAKEVL